jgi:hypothetical protein
MYGIDSELDKLNMSRPVLIQPFKQSNSEKKFFHIEFETNPINTNCDYRLRGQSQSLQINYHAVIIFLYYHLIRKFLSI